MIINTAIGVSLGIIILPFVLLVFAILISIGSCILMLPVIAFMIIALMLQPVYNFFIDNFSPAFDSSEQPTSCLHCNKKLKVVSFDNYCPDDDGFNPNKHCSYDCYNDLSNYKYRRSMIITGIIMLLIFFGRTEVSSKNKVISQRAGRLVRLERR